MCLARALDHAPGHALALALDAHLTAYLEGALTDALDQIDRALIDNPNEALAWLFRSNALARLDRGSEAVAAIERAAALSPLDPLSYFFDTFAAAAHTAAGTHQQALAHAQRSVRANATHLPGLVQLIVAEANAGQMDAARASAARYLSLRPTASVQRFIDHHPAQARASALRDAQALLAAGIPH